MSEKRKHYNEHRVGKKAFQAMLTQDENDLLAVVKKLRGIDENRTLLIELLTEEKKRLLKR